MRIALLTFSLLALSPIFWLVPLIGMAGEQPEEQLQKLRQRFPEADLNKDGKLTREEMLEFRRQMRPATTPAPPAAAAANETPAPANTTSSAGKVEIRVTSEKPVPINPKIYGINCAEMFIFDLVQKPEYLAALGELQLQTFSYPGGPSYYHHPTGSGGFNIRQEEVAQSKHGTDHRANKVGAPDFFQQYAGFVKPMKGHAAFVPNIFKGTVEELDIYLAKLMEAHIPVDCVVLGMEVQLGPFSFPDSAAYISAIKPYIEFLKSKYPSVRIVAWSTPVGRRAAVPGSFKQWNREVAKVPGIDGFAQYGWTEFGSAALKRRGGSEASTPEQRLQDYDAFVENFPAKQIQVYADDWGSDKKMFMLQWGTHADRNTALEGLHMANFYFFMTQYNAQHDNYFEVATWSVPLMQDLTSGKRKNSGGGMLYKENIALWTPYLYSKPLRYFYSGGKSLLTTSVTGVAKSGMMEVVKAQAGVGPDGKKYLCILNRGPAVALGGVTIDDKTIPADANLFVESVSGDTLSATGAALKTFAGNKTLGMVSLEPFSVTTLVFP